MFADWTGCVALEPTIDTFGVELRMQTRKGSPHITSLEVLHAYNAFAAVIGQVVRIGHGRRWERGNLSSTGAAILIPRSIAKASQQLIVRHVVNVGCHGMMAAIVVPTAAESTAVVARWASHGSEKLILQMAKIGVGMAGTSPATATSDSISTTIGTGTTSNDSPGSTTSAAHLLPRRSRRPRRR